MMKSILIFTGTVLCAAIFYLVVVHRSHTTDRNRPSVKNLDEWLPQSIAFFRNLGFFTTNDGLSDAELARLINDQHNREWGKNIDPSQPFSDLKLTSFDHQRVWWEDTEADVCDGNNVYVTTLQQWSVISRGSFSPIQIDEQWGSEQGPITVRFQHLGKSITIHPDFTNDYIDLQILPELNRIIKPSEIQFELFRAFDQTAFVVALKPEEKARLIRERGWRFAY